MQIKSTAKTRRKLRTRKSTENAKWGTLILTRIFMPAKQLVQKFKDDNIRYTSFRIFHYYL